MTAKFATFNQSFSSCASAAACASARISLVMDTVIIVAVSLFVLPLVSVIWVGM